MHYLVLGLYCTILTFVLTERLRLLWYGVFFCSVADRYMPNLGETTTKDSVDPAKPADTDSNVTLLPPKHGMSTFPISVGTMSGNSLLLILDLFCQQ